jgi:hypothetical protein
MSAARFRHKPRELARALANCSYGVLEKAWPRISFLATCVSERKRSALAHARGYTFSINLEVAGEETIGLKGLTLFEHSQPNSIKTLEVLEKESGLRRASVSQTPFSAGNTEPGVCKTHALPGFFEAL